MHLVSFIFWIDVSFNGELATVEVFHNLEILTLQNPIQSQYYWQLLAHYHIPQKKTTWDLR